MKPRLLGPPRISGSADVQRGPRICISNQFPGLLLLAWEPHSRITGVPRWVPALGHSKGARERRLSQMSQSGCSSGPWFSLGYLSSEVQTSLDWPRPVPFDLAAKCYPHSKSCTTRLLALPISPAVGTSYIICVAKWKMKIWGPLLENY